MLKRTLEFSFLVINFVVLYLASLTASAAASLREESMPLTAMGLTSVFSSRPGPSKYVRSVTDISQVVRVHARTIIAKMVKRWDRLVFLPFKYNTVFPEIKEPMGLPSFPSIPDSPVAIRQVPSPVPAVASGVYANLREYASIFFLGKHRPILMNKLAYVNIPRWTEADLTKLKEADNNVRTN